MRLLQRTRRSRAKTIRPAEPYLLAGAEQARRLGHNYIGTEHILSIVITNEDGTATHLLAQLGTTAENVRAALRAGDPRTRQLGERESRLLIVGEELGSYSCAYRPPWAFTPRAAAGAPCAARPSAACSRATRSNR